MSALAGGNGDGTLVYRGTAARIGGATEIPVASVRLKAIRDGQEDLLYMAAAERAVGRDAVLKLVAQIMSTAFAFYEDPSVMTSVREALAVLAEGT